MHPETLNPKQKEFATWEDVEQIIERRVFGMAFHDKWKCPREQIQMAAFILLIVATACWPGKLVLAKGYM